MGLREPPPRPFLKWVGGKRQLLPVLLSAVESAGGFRQYHEPFLGGGALFFALARMGRIRARAGLSDVNQNLMDAYLGVRDDVDGLIDVLRNHKSRHSEGHFYRVRAKVPSSLTERAARIVYLNKTCFNGLYRENSKGQFNTPFGRHKNPAICDEKNLRAVAATLRRTDIGARPFSSVLATAKRGDLVYFDPPYIPVSKTADFTAYSPEGFGAEAHEELAEVFTALARRGVNVVLSNSLTELTQQLYRGFYICPVLATRTVNSRADRRGKVSEAIVTNFPLASEQLRATRRSEAVKNGRTMGLEPLLAKDWLLEYGYPDVAGLINEVEAEWRALGKRTRRNWWSILAGNGHGGSRFVAGRKFPVLRAAQIRQGMRETENAISRSPREEPPAVRFRGKRDDAPADGVSGGPSKGSI